MPEPGEQQRGRRARGAGADNDNIMATAKGTS
jgi:hypothetical protein